MQLPTSILGFFGGIGRYFISLRLELVQSQTVIGRLDNQRRALLITLKLINTTQVPVLVESLAVHFYGASLLAIPWHSNRISFQTGKGLVVLGAVHQWFDGPFRLEAIGIQGRSGLFEMPDLPRESQHPLRFTAIVSCPWRRKAKLSFILTG